MLGSGFLKIGGFSVRFRIFENCGFLGLVHQWVIVLGLLIDAAALNCSEFGVVR